MSDDFKRKHHPTAKPDTDFRFPPQILVETDEFNLITYFHEQDAEKSHNNVATVKVAAYKTFLDRRMKSEAPLSEPTKLNDVALVAPMQTLVPEPVTRAPARTTTPPAARGRLGGPLTLSDTYILIYLFEGRCY
jgi:hypothetical protein